MSDDFRAKLRRLGVTKGTRNLKSGRKLKPGPPLSPEQQEPSRPPNSRLTRDIRPGRRTFDPDPVDIASLFPHGRVVETPYGSCFVVDRVYPLHHQHGQYALDHLFEFQITLAADFVRDERLGQLSYTDFLFIDTETTGLGGAATMAFLVGVAFFEQDACIVRQYFLRDHADESAMLYLLSELSQRFPALISFNGRSFDLPLLDNRYALNRMTLADGGEWSDRPHIDLLPPSRRIWRPQYQKCSLGALEVNVLGVRRTGEDVPGWAIPGMYNDYLRSRDPRPLQSVFYHNHIDMLSMVTLLARVLRMFDAADESDHPLDLLGVAKWMNVLGRPSRAEELLQMASRHVQEPHSQALILVQLTDMLKKDKRRDQARPLWESLVDLTPADDVAAHIELAKYFEWHAVDLTQALHWTQTALAELELHAPYEISLRQQLSHRENRIKRKLDKPR